MAKQIVSREFLAPYLRDVIKTYDRKNADIIVKHYTDFNDKELDDSQKTCLADCLPIARARAHAAFRRKAEDFWLNHVGLSTWFKQHGFVVGKDFVNFTPQLEKIMVKAFLEQCIIPDIEKTFNVTGIKVRNGVTGKSLNLFDFSRVEIKDDNNSSAL